MAINSKYHRLNFTLLVLVQVTCLMNLGGQFCFYGGLFLLFLSFKVLTRFSLFLFFCLNYEYSHH